MDETAQLKKTLQDLIQEVGYTPLPEEVPVVEEITVQPVDESIPEITVEQEEKSSHCDNCNGTGLADYNLPPQERIKICSFCSGSGSK